MANTTIQFKRNNNTGQAPTLGELSNGEIGINYHDGVIFFKNDANTYMFSKNANVIVVSGNTVSDGFNTWNIDNVLVSYTPSNGTFNIFPSNTITEIGNATTDIISLGDFESTTNIASSLVLRDAQGNIAVGNIVAVGGVFNNNVGINTGAPAYALDDSGGIVNTSVLVIGVIGANGTNIGFGGIGSANISPSDSFKNILINSGFEIKHRYITDAAGDETTFSNLPIYLVDRWVATGSGGTISYSMKPGSGLRKSSQNSLTIFPSASNTFCIEQPLTLDQISPLLQQNVCIQFLFADQNKSNVLAGNLIFCSLYVGTGAAQRRTNVSTFTNEIEVANVSLNVQTQDPSGNWFAWGTSNQQVPANTTQASLMFHGFATAGVGRLIFDNVQLEIGSVPTVYRDRTCAQEFELCKRFFQKSFTGGSSFSTGAPGLNEGGFTAVADVASDVFGGTIFLESVMYKIPTINTYNIKGGAGNTWTLAIGNTGNIGPVTPNVTLIGDASFSIFGTANATISPATGMVYVIGWDADAEL